jgi:hypothetical protein
MVMSAIEPKLKAQEAEIAKLANAKKAKKKSGVRTRARHPRPALGSQPRGAASHTRQGARQILRRGGAQDAFMGPSKTPSWHGDWTSGATHHFRAIVNHTNLVGKITRRTTTLIEEVRCGEHGNASGTPLQQAVA